MKLLFLILGIFTLSCADKFKKPLFHLIDPAQSGIDYSLVIKENDSVNMLSFTNFYTGSGVGLGDINNDGLTDVYFGSCMESGRLYLNTGNLKFTDITEKAGIETACWITGVSMVDINTDGYLDIYLNVSGPKSSQNTRNLLFINGGDLTFTEQASEYGIDDESQTTHSSFFDYDRDGDLDLFMIINPTNSALNYMGSIGAKMINGESKSTDKLFRNNGDNTFSDVSREAGILIEGYSLGLSTSDINGDGWVDVFVANDFLSNDILYINNGDGTFTDKAGEFFKHTSFSSMGTDIADIDNDGLPDIYVCDMYPADYYREKTMVAANSYKAFYYLIRMGYDPQYVRNVLQINNGNNTFSEIGLLAGVDKTDWSWASLFGDLDNDGFKDLYVTNGFTRDLGDLDFIKYHESSPFANPSANSADHYKAIVNQKGTPISNVVFKNNGDWTFSNLTDSWGLKNPSFSNGLAQGDLDNDGDLDLVVSNINAPAFIYENLSETLDHHYLRLKLIGDSKNPQGIGAKVKLYTPKGIQFNEKVNYRGYLSTVDDVLHFGLGKISTIDSIEIIWPDGNFNRYSNIAIDTTLTYRYGDKQGLPSKPTELDKMFTAINEDLSIAYIHTEDGFMDFAIQPLIPHEHTLNGPGIAVGDINNDGLDDFFIGGSANNSASFFIQKQDHRFVEAKFPHGKEHEDNGALLFDADNDGDLDLYVVSGGTFDRFRNPLDYQDRLYLNNGLGEYTYSKKSLPVINSSGSCVVAADFDLDNDLDLFVGGRLVPGKYPHPAESYLLRNNGGVFTDITSELLPEGKQIGMVTAALWTDIDNDLWPDLMITGEWMPIKIYNNSKGVSFKNIKDKFLKNSNGWWNSIVSGDFDKDGDIDYVAGNLGTNTYYKAGIKTPVKIYAKDFDNNGTIDPVMSCYYDDVERAIPLRDNLIEQISSMNRRFPDYNSYANATIYETFSKQEIRDAIILESTHYQSSYIENLGDRNFRISPLPTKCQVAPVFGMQVRDLNKDGNLDVLMVGNSYATHVLIGRYDAFTGIYMTGDGNGNFEASRGNENGFFVDTDARSLVSLNIKDCTEVFVVGSNSDSLKVFQVNGDKSDIKIDVHPNDVVALVELNDGSSYRQEFYYGSGYYSQSSRDLFITKELVNKITVINAQGDQRIVEY